MSDTDEHELSPASQLVAKSQSGTKKWQTLQADLNEAVQLWKTLETQIQPLSPEEAQLKELKNLIAQVKAKLESFDL